MKHGLLRATRFLQNYHIQPPTTRTMEAYYRYKSQDPEIVHFKDTDGEQHTMSWEDYKTYQAAQLETKNEEESLWTVSLKNVTAEGSRLAYAQKVFKNTPLDEAEANAKFMTNVQYGEIILALIQKARKDVVKRGLNPAHVRMLGYRFHQQSQADKHILFRGKGYHGEYIVRKFTVTGYFREDPRTEDVNLKRDRYFSWKYGKRSVGDGAASELDVPALGVDGL
eukprot:TRINITY_DN21061_c0_g1_i1.p1 TRINITY_DN21061_c0_g1~~TRINITY_DN21061_c0_g1_i1.p1  ORF type:complete len:224 (+),score=25.02 TRINITY_DN21061_c0_g1_i1:43-714(+)